MLTKKLKTCKSPLDGKDFGTKGTTSCFVGFYLCFGVTSRAIIERFSLQALERCPGWW